MQSLACTLLESSYNFKTTLLIITDAEINILMCQGFSEKIFSLLSKQLRKTFDGLYWARILVREKLGSSNVGKTTTIMWATL